MDHLQRLWLYLERVILKRLEYERSLLCRHVRVDTCAKSSQP